MSEILRVGMTNYSHTFWLPFPPSVNRIWRYAKGRAHKSAPYVEWIGKADAAGQLQKVGRLPVLGRYALELRLSDAFRRHGDADNRIKAVADWCQRARLIADDRYGDKSTVEWDAVTDHDCLVTLTGEVAFRDQWDFAQHIATIPRKRKRRATPETETPRLTKALRPSLKASP